MGPLSTLFSNPLPTPLLTRTLKNYFYRHFGVSEILVPTVSKNFECTPRESCDNTPTPRRVLGRVLDTAFEKDGRRVLRRRLVVDFRGRKDSEKGS